MTPLTGNKRATQFCVLSLHLRDGRHHQTPAHGHGVRRPDLPAPPLRDEALPQPCPPSHAVADARLFLRRLVPGAHLHHPPPPPIVVDAVGYPTYYDHCYLPHPPNSAVHVTPEQREIHTIFVSGLPDDVKPREIHNLFRRRPGFESCQLKYTGRGDLVVAFASFINHQSAMAAMSVLNGVIFDPHTGATLHIELAQSNSRTKCPRGGGAYAVIDKRVKDTNDDQETSSNDGDDGSDEPSGTDNDNSSNKGALAAIPSGEAASCTDNALATAHDVEAMKKLQGTLLLSSDRGGLHLEYARFKMRKG